MKKHTQTDTQTEVLPRHIKADELANLLGITRTRLKQLRADGALVVDKSMSPPRYLLVESLVQYASYLKKKEEAKDAQRRSMRATADYKERKAELMLLELRKRRGELHEARHIRAIFTDNILSMRAELLALPARVAPELAGCSDVYEVHAVLKRAIYDVLHTLAHRKYDPEEFAKMVREEGGYTFEDDEDDEDDEVDAPAPPAERACRASEKRRTDATAEGLLDAMPLSLLDLDVKSMNGKKNRRNA